MIALAELHLLNQDLDACQSILQTVLKNNKDNDQATLVCTIYQYLFSLKEVCDPCLLYTSPSPRDGLLSRMPSSA